MEDEKSFQTAMVKYEIIASLLHHSNESLQSRITKLSERFWTLPSGELKRYTFGTIESWYYLYKQKGIDALRLVTRKDKGSFKAIDPTICKSIDDILIAHPKIKTTVLIKRLRDQKIIMGKHPSESSIYRYIRFAKGGLSIPSQERLAFEAPYAGSLWQTDIMYGPYLLKKNSRDKWCKKQTYLIGIIDDHSRILCHGEFFFEQDLLAYLSCLKTALQKRGIPERLYCDNGQVFLSSQIKRIMAKLGTNIIHARPRDAAAKGKIERFFRTVRDNFLEELLTFNIPKTLEELNNEFYKWSEDNYNHKKHSSIGMKPVEKWLLSSHKIKTLSVDLEDEIFYFTTTRKVKKDGTFSLNNMFFETSYQLAKQKVSIHYDPFMPERVNVSLDGKNYGKATLLNRTFNSNKPRKNNNNKKENKK